MVNICLFKQVWTEQNINGKVGERPNNSCLKDSTGKQVIIVRNGRRLLEKLSHSQERTGGGSPLDCIKDITKALFKLLSVKTVCLHVNVFCFHLHFTLCHTFFYLGGLTVYNRYDILMMG